MKQNLTTRQQKLVTLLKQELLKQNGSKTLGELMVLAGYSQKTARLPSNKALNSEAVQDSLKDFIDQLDEKARMALRLLTESKIKTSSGRDISYIVDILTKNKQLLSGNATEKMSINVEISEEIAKKNA